MRGETWDWACCNPDVLSDPPLMALISLNRASSLKLRLLDAAGLSVFFDVVYLSERSSDLFDLIFYTDVAYYFLFAVAV